MNFVFRLMTIGESCPHRLRVPGAQEWRHSLSRTNQILGFHVLISYAIVVAVAERYFEWIFRSRKKNEKKQKNGKTWIFSLSFEGGFFLRWEFLELVLMALFTHRQGRTRLLKAAPASTSSCFAPSPASRDYRYPDSRPRLFCPVTLRGTEVLEMVSLLLPGRRRSRACACAKKKNDGA